MCGGPLRGWPGCGVPPVCVGRAATRSDLYNILAIDAAIAPAGCPDRQNSLDHCRLALLGAAGILG